MSQKVCELVFYSSRISLCACGRHQFPCEMIRICICMEIPPAGLSARHRVLLPLTALCWIEMIHWLVGQTKFNLTTNSLKRKRGPSHRRDYHYTVAVTAQPVVLPLVGQVPGAVANCDRDGDLVKVLLV